MAQITKTVDKTMVSGSEIFIYTINAAYSGLTIPNQEGKIIDFIPSKIKYMLPPVGGQIESIIETPVSGGTQIIFNLGTVNSGTSISFTVACYFGPGRVSDESYTNQVDLVVDNEVVAQTTAPTVNLKLKEDFILTKFAQPSNVVNPGDEITFILSLANNGDPGADITNVVISDILPPELTPVTSFIPVGKDIPSRGYSDSTANGLTGSWEDNALNFKLAKYNGVRYDITFKVQVSESVTLGQTFDNIGTWTMDGVDRNDATLNLSIYDPSAEGFSLFKYGTRTTIIGAPIDYELRNENIGNVTLSNYELEDIIPWEIDITAFYVEASTGLVNYNIDIALDSNPSIYIPVVTNIASGAYPYTDLKSVIPQGDRVSKIKLTAQNLLVTDSKHSLFVLGITNETAVMGGSYTNKAVARSGIITQTKLWKTLVNGASDLSVQKKFSPSKEVYYPLDEFNIILTANTLNTISIDPILADLMPKGLRYVVDSEYFIYYEKAKEITYDSREPDFPVPLPTREIIPNFSDTESTLIRWNFSNFILPTSCNIKIIFKVFVEINAPSSFVNKGYMGVYGDNVFAVYDEIIDTQDIDGDGLTTDRISCEEVSGIILSSSEFSIKKFVKGEKDLEYSSKGFTVPGGNIDYQLQITNTQPMDLKDIEIVDILPYVGDTGVILTNQQRGSQFDVYATSAVTVEIINVIGDPVDPYDDIIIEYSTSNDPKRFDELDQLIGTGDWSLTPPADISTLRAIKVTTGPTVTLHPYERLIIHFGAKAPIGTPNGKIAYNSYAVRANKITGSGTEPLLPTEPNKVEVTISGNKLGSIGDMVWYDLNGNGRLDEEEVGVNGVTVNLYDNSGNLLKSTITTNNFNGSPGYYLFTDLSDGIYQVKFIPFGDYALTQQQSSEVNGSKPDQNTGFTSYITMSNAQQILDIDAGLVKKSEGPVIYVTDKCVHVGDTFDPMEEVSAVDGNKEDITDHIIVLYNDVDTSIPNVYEVTYSVTDSYGQTATITIEVTVCKSSPRQQAITDILESVALEQAALSHILNAEGEKIQKAKELDLPLDEMIKINKSVKNMVESVAKLEMVLQSKLQLFETIDCSDDCCNGK